MFKIRVQKQTSFLWETDCTQNSIICLKHQLMNKKSAQISTKKKRDKISLFISISMLIICIQVVVPKHRPVDPAEFVE